MTDITRLDKRLVKLEAYLTSAEERSGEVAKMLALAELRNRQGIEWLLKRIQALEEKMERIEGYEIVEADVNQRKK